MTCQAVVSYRRTVHGRAVTFRRACGRAASVTITYATARGRIVREYCETHRAGEATFLVSASDHSVRELPRGAEPR